ncbi:MAG: Rpn family recombination-promoting nuclease/putative transposase, partial [Bacteroidota bacterium]
IGNTALDRKAIFDIYCKSTSGERFIVEIQKAKQNFFKDRSLYYSTFPIQQQAKRGDWNFELQAVYTIAILDFVFEEGLAENDKYLYHVQLTDTDTCKVFFDKLTFIYLEMPKFSKGLDELQTRFDKWLYVLKYLPQLQDRPAPLQERVFQKLFDQAEIAQFSPEERDAYEDSLKYYRDLKNVIDTAWEEGREEGIEEGLELASTIVKLFQSDNSISDISRDLQIPKSRVESILRMMGLLG